MGKPRLSEKQLARIAAGLCRNCGAPVVEYDTGRIPRQCWVSGPVYECRRPAHGDDRTNGGI